MPLPNKGALHAMDRYKELLAAALEAYAAGLSTEGGGSDGDGGPSPADGARWEPQRRLVKLVAEAASAGLRADDFAGK